LQVFVFNGFIVAALAEATSVRSKGDRLIKNS